jgi:antitoxin FitA
MPTVTVKNIPDNLYDYLKQTASLNHRSVNSEIIVCLERTLRSQKISTEATLTRARHLRERTSHYPLSDAKFATAKTAGRA